MKRYLSAVAAVVLAAMMLTACGGKKAETPAAPEGTPATPDQLVTVWDQLVAAPQDQIDFKLAHAVAQDISVRGAEGIAPLLKKIDVETPTPQSIVLTLAALRDQIKPEHEALLVELAGPTKGSYTRRVAIDLLGSLETESATQKLLEMQESDDPLISIAAFLSLLPKNSPEAVARLKGHWDNPAVHDASRQEMIRRLPEQAAPQAIEQLCATLAHPEWDVDVRRRAVQTLGFLTDPRALEALKSAADSFPEPELREFALKAVQSMQARIDAGTTIQEVEVGPDGITKVTTPLTATSGLATPDIATPAAEPATAQ
jgi:HEAT repeat protein